MFPVDFKGDLTNATDRHSWVLEQIKIVEENFLDGLNVDYEKAIGKGQPKLRDGLTALVKELATALRSRYKNSQVFRMQPVGLRQALQSLCLDTIPVPLQVS